MKRIIFLATAISSVLLSLPATAQELTGTLKKIKDSGMITIGHRESSVPFSYYDDKQNVIGYSLDICAGVVEHLKTTLKMDKIGVKYVPVTGATRIPLMANGTIDLECGSTTNNLERQQQVGFSNTFYLTANTFVTKKSANLTKVQDLKGKNVVSTAGTTNIKQLNDVNNERGLMMNIITAKDHAEAFLLVETGRADAFVMDDILLASLVANAKTPDAYTISDDALSLPEPYAPMVRRDDAPFKAAVDEATGSLYRSDAMPKLYAKWFQSPIPPKGLVLNVPMSAKLKKAFATPSSSGDPSTY